MWQMNRELPPLIDRQINEYPHFKGSCRDRENGTKLRRQKIFNTQNESLGSTSEGEIKNLQKEIC